MSKLIAFLASARASLAAAHTMELNADIPRDTFGMASEIGGCARKAVLELKKPSFYSDRQHMVFERGHIYEMLMEKYLQTKGFMKVSPEKFPSTPGPCYVGGSGPQMGLCHPDYPVGCHIDFCIKQKDGSMHVIETKTTDGLPEDPYGSWVEQLHTQIGLLQMFFPTATIRGSIIARDLNKGREREYNGYAYNENLFEYVVGKGIHLALAKRGEVKPNLDPGPLCGFCNHQKSCPARACNQPLPHEIANTTAKLVALKEKEKALKAEIETAQLALLAFTGEQAFKGESDEVQLVVTAVAESVSVDSKKLKDRFPDIYGEVTKPKAGYIKVEARRKKHPEVAEIAKAA